MRNTPAMARSCWNMAAATDGSSTRTSTRGPFLTLAPRRDSSSKGLWKRDGLDVGMTPTRQMAAYAGNQLGIQVIPSPLEDYRTDERFDVVSMIQVLPHFVDPPNSLDHARRLTKPGGCLLIETWNCKSWTARMWGEHWHEYSPPSVLHWFSPATLRRFANDHGFRRNRDRPSKKVHYRHTRQVVGTIQDNSLGIEATSGPEFTDSPSPGRALPGRRSFLDVFSKKVAPRRNTSCESQLEAI